MIALVALLAFVFASTKGCDLPYLCFKVDEAIKSSDSVYLRLQIVENKIDIIDKKADRAVESSRLQITLAHIDKSRFDVSGVYKERIYIASKTEASFDIQSANNECKTQGGYLLELDDDDERLFTLNFVEKIGGGSLFATGGNDIDTPNTWVYYNSGKPRPKDLVWLPGEPNNNGGNESCMVLWVDKKGLNDVKCEISMKYVCEISLRPI